MPWPINGVDLSMSMRSISHDEANLHESPMMIRFHLHTRRVSARAVLAAIMLAAVAALPVGPANAQDRAWSVCTGPDRAERAVSCVVDGDTFWTSGVRIRLSCINTPELGEPGFVAARDALARHLARPGASLLLEGRADRFGRQLGAVLVDGQAIDGAMVATGLARWTDYRASRAFCAALRGDGR